MELHKVLDLKPEGVEEDVYLRLNDYPIFDEEHRTVLNEKIKNHYMYQEIGRESVNNFLFALRNKMHEVMPLYNKLYESEKIAFDPLRTVDISNTGEASNEEESTTKNDETSASATDSKSKQVSSNFPQNQLRGAVDYATAGADGNSQTEVTNEAVSEGEARSAGTSASESHTTGYQGSPAMLLQQYRATLMNIDMLVIAELTDLFMIVWNNADNYSHYGGRFDYS